MLEVIIALSILCLKHGKRVWDISYAGLDRWLLDSESRLGRFKGTAMATGLLMAGAMLYVRPASHCDFMGKHAAAMASGPFALDPSNPVPHRILTPLISYAVGLRGQLVIVTNLLIATALVLAVYLYFRKHAERPGDALIAAATMAFSFVTLQTIYCGGYTDSTNYLLVFLMWIWRSRRLLFYSLFLLGLMNREAVLFLVPWFVFISLEDCPHRGRRALELAAGLGMALGLYGLFRLWLAGRQEAEYSTDYYLAPLLDDPLSFLRLSIPTLGVGLFSVFKALWIVPCAAAASMWRSGQRREILSGLLLLVCAGAQLLVAYDVSRLMAFSFMIMIVSLLHLFRTNALSFRRWIGWAFLFNLLIPNVNVAAHKIDVMHSLIYYLIEHSTRH